MLVESIFTIIVAVLSSISLIIYYIARKGIINDNKSRFFPQKKKNSTRIWILNSIFQAIVLTLAIVVPFRYVESRPEAYTIIPSWLLNASAMVLLVITALALGAHTLSVYLVQFIEDKNSRLHAENELFHGPISHIPPYLALIFFTWIFAILEKQHPLEEVMSLWERSIIVLSGLIAGITLAASTVIAGQGKVLFRAAFINTAIWFLWLTWQFNIAAGPLSTFAVAINFTIIGCNGVMRDRFKKFIHEIYDLPKYD